MRLIREIHEEWLFISQLRKRPCVTEFTCWRQNLRRFDIMFNAVVKQKRSYSTELMLCVSSWGLISMMFFSWRDYSILQLRDQPTSSIVLNESEPRALMSIWALLFTGDAHHMATRRHHNDWPNFLTKSTWVSSSDRRSEGIAHALNSSAGKVAGFAKSNCSLSFSHEP